MLRACLALIFLTQGPTYSGSYRHISQLSGFPYCVPKRHLHEGLRRFELPSLGLLSFFHIEHMRSPSLPSLPLNSSTTVHKEFFSKKKKDVNGVEFICQPHKFVTHTRDYTRWVCLLTELKAGPQGINHKVRHY